MAGLDFSASPDRSITTNGNIAVSRSIDGGRHWKTPVVVLEGRGADTSRSQMFFDKEYLTGRQQP